jgi:hypothetical protein
MEKLRRNDKGGGREGKKKRGRRQRKEGAQGK